MIWSIGMKLEEGEKNIIEAALRFFNGNKTMAANSLGISVRGLDSKMERLEINGKKRTKTNSGKQRASKQAAQAN